MNDNLSRAGLTLLIIVTILLSVAYVKHLADRDPQIIYIQDPNFIPSARQIQQRLKDLDDPRYDPGPIDGILGPKMIRGWDNLIIDRYAIREIEGR